MNPSIRFDDADAYQHYMGGWSRAVGQTFIDWLALPAGLDWLDVGCGNGAFTALIAERQAPTRLLGIDPSPEQLAAARLHPSLQQADFCRAQAEALPFADASVDVSIMPLVIFFLPEPELGLAQMQRVTRPGGTLAAYAWDMPGGGFPYAAMHAELKALGHPVAAPPSAQISRRDALEALWQDAGLANVESCVIEVAQTFERFEDYWHTATARSTTRERLASLSETQRTTLKNRLCARLPADADGRVQVQARAHAVRGQRPR